MTHSISRRTLLAAAAGGCALAATSWAAAPRRPGLARVIVDNDFAGDPDGLFALAHHLLCPSVEIPLIVGSHLPANTPWSTSTQQATDAANEVHALLRVMKTKRNVVAGAQQGIATRDAWRPSDATAAIIREALRDDADTPLVYAAGAGLTDLAIAWLTEPKIGRRVKLVWIGGNEHAGLAYPQPGPPEPEFNFTIDPIAAQIVFNESDIEIWQVPRDAYRQMLVTTAELHDLARMGALAAHLVGRIDRLDALLDTMPGGLRLPRTETYVLGDSPLVTLTALQSPFNPDPSSSRYARQPTPRLNERGDYEPRPDGRTMRIYTGIDARLTFRDMASKFREYPRRSK